MENKSKRLLSPFDELTMPSELQIIKLLLPYTPIETQKTLGIFIKFLELQHTFRIYQNFTSNLQSQSTKSNASFTDILEEIAPYLSESQANSLQSFRTIINIMEIAQTFQTATNDATSDSPLDPINLMMGTFTPEQQEMFQMYQTMFNQEGDSKHERMDESSTSKEYRSSEIQPDSNGSNKDIRKIGEGTDASHDGADHSGE